MLEGSKVCLRPIDWSDTDNIVKWRNSEWVQPYFIDHTPLTREIHENWLRTRVFTGRVAQFIIVEKEENRDVGTVYLRDIDVGNSHAEFGIYVGEPTQRKKGLGQEAAELICRYGFEELGLHRIYLRVLADNQVAIRCYEKVGFVMEGTLREHTRNQQGWHDVVMMGYLNPNTQEK